MAKLLIQVLPPDALTRISDYVEEVVTFTEDIISNGYAYRKFLIVSFKLYM